MRANTKGVALVVFAALGSAGCGGAAEAGTAPGSGGSNGSIGGSDGSTGLGDGSVGGSDGSIGGSDGSIGGSASAGCSDGGTAGLSPYAKLRTACSLTPTVNRRGGGGMDINFKIK